MPRTKLYLPYTGFQINDGRGEQILLESLIANGPSYKIVVHENPEWHRLQEEEILIGDWIEIITNEEANTIKAEVERFFSPLIEGLYVNDGNYQHPIPAVNQIMYMKKALSYILIASKRKAWIYGDEIIADAMKEVNWFIENKNNIREDEFFRVTAFNDLLSSYTQSHFSHLSMIDNPNILHDFLDVMDNALVQNLSEMGYSIGSIGYDFNILERDIRASITNILHSRTTPYLIGGAGIITSVLPDPNIGRAVTSLGIISHGLRNVDLRDYAPPMRKEELFIFPRYAHSFSIKYFNNDYQVFLPPKPPLRRQT
jgi:hypothetical protein